MRVLGDVLAGLAIVVGSAAIVVLFAGMIETADLQFQGVPLSVWYYAGFGCLAVVFYALARAAWRKSGG